MGQLQPLKDRYKGKTIAIVGSGPSLRFLDETYLGHSPIIAINQSIYKLQEMNVHGQLYSLQLDGCANRGTPGHQCLMKPLRDDVILILSAEEWQSRYCSSWHKNTYLASCNDELGLPSGVMSIRAAVKLAHWFGAKNVQIFCCDSFVGVKDSYNVETDEIGNFVESQDSYIHGALQAKHDLGKTPYQVILPQKGVSGNGGLFRVEALRKTMLELRDKYQLKYFIETGTLYASTTEWASNHFEKVWTIDIWEPYYQKALRLNKPNVMPVLGDSRVKLPQVLAEVPEQALIWLDAHWNGTRGRDYDCPILVEIRELKRCPIKHIVMIDDASLFDYWNEWPALELVKKAVQESYDIEIRDDAIICIPKELAAKE